MANDTSAGSKGRHFVRAAVVVWPLSVTLRTRQRAERNAAKAEPLFAAAGILEPEAPTRLIRVAEKGAAEFEAMFQRHFRFASHCRGISLRYLASLEN